MLELYFKYHRVIARFRRSALGNDIDGIAADLSRTGFDTRGKLRSMRTAWTILAEPDLFAKTSAGRSWFRIDDLLRLAAEIAELTAPSNARRR